MKKRGQIECLSPLESPFNSPDQRENQAGKSNKHWLDNREGGKANSISKDK